MNNEPQKYPKWIQAPEGWSHVQWIAAVNQVDARPPAGKPSREFHVGTDGKIGLIVQDEQDEMEIINLALL